MSHKNVNVSYWKQCASGKTGYCLTQRTQKVFDRVAPLFEKVTGSKLSKMRLYDQALPASREVKADTGAPMIESASAVMGIQLQELHRKLRDIKKSGNIPNQVQFESMEVDNLQSLAKQSLKGRKFPNRGKVFDKNGKRVLTPRVQQVA